MADQSAIVHPADEAVLHDWPLRPWLLAALLGLAGLLVYFAADGGENVPWRMALAAAAVFGPLALAFTLAQDRWKAPAIFAAAVALVMAGIAWRATSAGDRYADEEFWVAAGILAVTLALPLFQAGFHRLRWGTSYKVTHFHVWTDAISGAGALAFVGLAWALIALLAELFSVIKIDLLEDLIDETWFGWLYSGAAFGAALGVLRNQLKIIGTLQNVVLLVLSILAVPLAIALVIFLLAVAASGLDVLWEATKSATPLLLSIAVGCFVLANAVVRDEDEQASNSRILRLAGFVLALGILPLSVMAAISMGTRIGQHGLSPERLWALVAIAVAVAYGVGYFVAALRGRRAGWRDLLRQANLHLAVLTCVIAFILALPLFNFGAVSASNQLARLERGDVSADDFDYVALRWDFGEAGRDALAKLAKSENAEIAKFASDTLKLDRRPYYGTTRADQRELAAKARITVTDPAVEKALRAHLEREVFTCPGGCRAVEVGEVEAGPLIALIIGENPQFLVYDREKAEIVQYWVQDGKILMLGTYHAKRVEREGRIELRRFEGRQLYVGDQPVGQPFE
ncbi:DUF4153 domain-containing protein [Altererythrobacter sp. BO-6]|uniref:DUF4153 domain-containing protein n=1 Tax=Altererythrobacter sp. BO-6 TaxID=2604537 RepID=UPI0013E100D5|nr:DUF4153 domain-containing protein [Altererythrobacter sp. BO-6]QIG54818.1 DUF4153 domain-containing protein [Altererythrobacter sp. BO-6]